MLTGSSAHSLALLVLVLVAIVLRTIAVRPRNHRPTGPPWPPHQGRPGHEGGEPLVAIVGDVAVLEVHSSGQGRRQQSAEHEEFVQH